MVRERGRPGCAAESVDRDEPLIATASRVRRWLIIEQPGPWGREALIESRLDATVARTVRSHARRANVRVLLARQPSWDSSDSGQRAFLVRSDRVHRWIEQVDLADPHELVGLDLAVLDSDDPPGIGRPGPANLHLVCTNGKHDACCADFGRPVIRALREAEAPDVWECSHVGGDRFAANVVCLPTGVYFGRVAPEESERIVREHGEGLLDLDCYRGRSCYPPLIQAAEIFARRELDERRLDALHISGAQRHGDESASVMLDHADKGGIEVEVTREQGPLALLTCNAQGRSNPWSYRLVDLRYGDR